MPTSGYGNDALMILVPVAVTLVVGVTLLGGPTDALETANAIVSEVAYEVMVVVRAML